MYWTVKVDGGPRRVNHAAIAINGQIYSFGGYCSGEYYDGSQPIDVHILNTETYRWHRLSVQHEDEVETDSNWLDSQVPYQRYGHTVVEYQGKAYLWGGRNDEYGACARMHQFDPETLSWSTIPCSGFEPSARDGHSAVVFNGSMYIFGGFEEDLQRFSRETYAYNFERNEWNEIKTTGAPPQWRDFHTACVIDSKMYIFGGRSDLHGEFHSSRDFYCGRLKMLDLKTGVWSNPQVTGTKPSGRRSHSAWVYRGKMYVFGGYLGTEHLHMRDLYEFNPQTLQWRLIQPIGAGPSVRRRQCTVLVGSRVFLFGGTMPSSSSKGDQEYSNLSDLSDLYVLDYEPTLKDLSAVAVLRNGFNETYKQFIPPDLRNDLQMMTQPNKITLTRHEG